MTKITVTTNVSASLATVRDARNNPLHIVNRCFAGDDRCCPSSTNDLKVGGLMCTRMEAKDGSFGFDMTAKYDIVEPMNRISYTMGSYEKDSDFVDAGRVVDITFSSLLDKGGAEGGGFGGVYISETFDAEDIHDLAMQEAGWSAILENFRKYAERISAIPLSINLGFRFDEEKLWAIEIPTKTIDINELENNLDIAYLESIGTDDRNLTPKMLIENFEKETPHATKVNNADTQYPIEIYFFKGQRIILDGVHRFVKIYMSGNTTIKVRKITDEMLQSIKYNPDEYRAWLGL